MLPRIRQHVKTIANFGPRQTGQAGCDKTYDYIKKVLAEAAPGSTINEFSMPVTVAIDRTDSRQLQSVDDEHSQIVLDDGTGQIAMPAYSLQPNCVQACQTHPAADCPLAKAGRPQSAGQAGAEVACPNCEQYRPLIDLRDGTWGNFDGKDLTNAVVLFDFRSRDAWLRAASLGAYGAIFVEDEQTTVFQADDKYLATLPLHFPRLYVNADEGSRLRQALQAKPAQARICLKNRIRFANVPAKGLDLTIPGKNRSYCFVLAGHFDARSIAPDLSFGQSELWGLAELLEVVRYLQANQPECDIRIVMVSGHWQSQQLMRQYVKAGGPHYDEVGDYIRLAMSIDLSPDGRSINLLPESVWDGPSVTSGRAVGWIRTNLFGQGGWRDQIMRGFSLPANQPADVADRVEIFAGHRPIMADNSDTAMADRNNRSPFVYAPRYPTAEEPWQTLPMTTWAFQTSRLTRLEHNTPLDRLRDVPDSQIDQKLRPQLQMTLGVLGLLQEYPVGLLPKPETNKHIARGWGGYAELTGKILQWDKSIGWFAERLPQSDGPAKMQTLLHAYPSDEFLNAGYGRVRNFVRWPQVPTHGQHRELQSFTFQDYQLLEEPAFRLDTVYSAMPETQYNVVAYSIDSAGRIRYATDYGVHGDANKAFQCTDVPLDDWKLYVPVSLFECGSVELMDLVDPQRYDPRVATFGAWLFYFAPSHGGYGEIGVSPSLQVMSVRDTKSHTDMERWGCTQYGPTAMLFLPAGAAAPSEILLGGWLKNFAVEILLGSWFRNFAVLNSPAAAASQPSGAGFRLQGGQTVRLSSADAPTPARCVEQLTQLDGERIGNFARYDVSSPLAHRYHARAGELVKKAQEARSAGKAELARAYDLQSWIIESQAYRATMGLLVDVVSTTVLYFVMLIPFSFLLERLVLPRRTIAGTAITATIIFAVFVAILYMFHPGFKLASNVVVTTTAFVIVVMTLPALVLLLVRGVAMLRAIGSKAVITQRSEAESAGMVMASLSLAVSNMRRRRLRTALTLTTITTLVVALVLLTTSSAFDFKILEPGGISRASFQGIEIYNAIDRRFSLIKEMADIYEATLSPTCLVVPREGINYGYDHKSDSGTLYLEANNKRTRLPYLQVMDHRDNLIEYTLLQGEPEGGRKLRLADLMEGQFLQDGDEDVILLPDNMATDLGVKIGDSVRLMGLELKVKGIWQSQMKQVQADGTAMAVPGLLDRLTDLDGLPITTLRQSVFSRGEMDNPLHAPSSEMVIIPRRWVQKTRIFPTCVYSLIVIPNDLSTNPAGMAKTAETIAKEVLNVDVFTHRVDPATNQSIVEHISMRTATAIKGSSMMFIVLAVAVLMILAIMTGTVYERMKEIHIFSSVGLSPRHVAGMFFIEALVLAGIAAVLGYFVGIIALKLLLGHLKATGQHVDFYPNYLGVFVLYSIGIAVLATLGSSIYPIRLASKIINPAEGRNWQATPPEGQDIWPLGLPFIATNWNEAVAMMVYAYDFIAIHQGERSGQFVCQQPPRGRIDGKVVELSVPIWLAPFERNVSQDMLLRISPTADGAWWEMSMELRRLSGPNYLWLRGSKVFINLLCKHLLRWRAATAQQEADCLSRAPEIYKS